MNKFKPKLSSYLFVVVVIEALLIVVFYFVDPYNYQKSFPTWMLFVVFAAILLFNYLKKTVLSHLSVMIIFLVMLLMYFF